jgi:Secretion system C-terminal sorting domain
MKQALVLSFMLFSCKIAFTQCPITYTYDAAGNRIKRISPNCLGGSGSDRSQAEAEVTGTTAEITVFPNPSSGEITITGKEISPTAIVRFFDAETRLMYERSLGDGIFDTSTWAAGMYWIQILDQEKTQIIRFVKSQH